MLALFSLFLSLWALVSAQVTVYPTRGPVPITDLYGSHRGAEAATGCTRGRPTIWLASTASVETLVHETAHAYDCIDDGLINGSPGLRPAARPAWASDYCWDADAEWYACSVVYYRDVHPLRVAPSGATPGKALVATTTGVARGR
jgi:hypothetical protein